MSIVLDDYEQDLDIDFTPNGFLTNSVVAESSYRYKPKRGQSHNSYFNPYKMNPFDVRKADFSEARIYDDNISEAGWRIPTYVVKRNYRRWLYKTRQEPGMRGFRRAFRHRDEDDDDNEEEAVSRPVRFVTRPTNIRQSQTGKNRNVRLMPQSRVKGANLGDDEFKAKTFTSKMGTSIGALRQQLNMTQVDLARKLNVDVAMIRNIEKGGLINFNSEDVMVKEMAKVLGVASIKYHE